MRAHSGYSYIWILPVVQVVAQRARVFYFYRTPFAAGSSNVRCEVECRRGYRRKEFAFFVGLQPALWLAFVEAESGKFENSTFIGTEQKRVQIERRGRERAVSRRAENRGREGEPTDQTQRRKADNAR